MVRISSSPVIRSTAGIIIISYSTAAYASVAGRIDFLLHTEQSADYTLNRIEEQAEISWRNRNTKEAGLQFNLRHQYSDSFLRDNHNTDLQIRQIFFAENISAGRYTLGRFNRSDPLGFYTLDGISIKYQAKNWKTDFHAGRPLQIEDYKTVDADSVRGISVRYYASQIDNPYVQNINTRIGWQQLNGETKQNYMHWGITANSNTEAETTPPVKVFFNGSYLHEQNTLETLDTGIQIYSKKQDIMRFSYSRWQPRQAQLSFRERFYAVYANERQSVLQGDFFQSINWHQKYYLRGRKVWRQRGNNGCGATAGFEQQSVTEKALSWQVQWDFLILDEDYIHSLYLQINKNISATTLAYFNTAVQYQHNESSDNNQLIALQSAMQTMLRSNLFMTFFGRYIYNENSKNEYRFDFRFSYRFDNRQWGL